MVEMGVLYEDTVCNDNQVKVIRKVWLKKMGRIRVNPSYDFEEVILIVIRQKGRQDLGNRFGNRDVFRMILNGIYIGHHVIVRLGVSIRQWKPLMPQVRSSSNRQVSSNAKKYIIKLKFFNVFILDFFEYLALLVLVMGFPILLLASLGTVVDKLASQTSFQGIKLFETRITSLSLLI